MKEFFESKSTVISEWSPNVNIHRLEDFQDAFRYGNGYSMDAVDMIPVGSCIKVELSTQECTEKRFLLFPRFVSRGR